MTWKIRFFIIVAATLPAFTGYPVKAIDTPIVTGISRGWLGYWLVANGLIATVLGWRHWTNTIAVASLITLPVVFVGGTVSYAIFAFGLGHPGGPADYSAHYVALSLTMLTVIPLALSLVAVVPFHRIEDNLLAHPRGVGRIEKILLMFLRVFNHIVYTVIPNILEVMREENRLRIGWAPGGRGLAVPRELVRTMIRIGIEGICAAVQYIPLWAVEISRLPDKKPMADPFGKPGCGGRS